MRRVPRLSVVLLLAALVAAPAVAGDLPEPKPNEGATQVEIRGTEMTAEAWAVAHGKIVETVVVTRLVPQEGKAPKVESYERWSVDGKRRFQRGDKKLGKVWEKHLWTMLDEAVAGKKLPRKKGELLDRVQRHLGHKGSRQVGGWVVGWSLGQGESMGGGKRSLARIAVFTFTPGAPTDDVTPPARKKPTTPSAKDKRKDAPGGAKKKPAPVTPAPKTDERWPFPLPKDVFRKPGGGFGGVSGSVRGSANSETGVRKHARITVDLGAIPVPAPKKPAEPRGPVTPKQR